MMTFQSRFQVLCLVKLLCRPFWLTRKPILPKSQFMEPPRIRRSPSLDHFGAFHGANESWNSGN